MDDSTLAVQLLPHMQFVSAYDESLRGLAQWWQKVTLIGKINSQQVGSTLLDDMEGTKQRFEELQEQLVANLVAENVRKLEQELGARAQVAIDILVRNLFERTADVGFLSTDDDIRSFLLDPQRGDRDAIVERLREYTLKYSVYDEIIILDTRGQVCAHLDADNPIGRCEDPLIEQAVHSDAPYLEHFGPSDLQPQRRAAHIFAARICADDQPHSQVLGVLCLCFRFEDEMTGIFANLARSGEVVALLDDQRRVIASSRPAQLALASAVAQSGNGLHVMNQHGERHLGCTVPGKGYQGYFGLNWLGHGQRPVARAFGGETEKSSLDEAVLRQMRCVSDEIRSIGRHAAHVTDDLTLIVLNGQIISAKRDAKEFMPILDEIRSIGVRTKGVFDASITNLYNTVIASLLSEVQLQAFVAVDIMDRNLYERANDVRWWALTSRFRELMAKPSRDDEDVETLEAILAYINGLYTVYTNLLLFDTHGTVVAVSDAAQRHWVGRSLGSGGYVAEALALRESQRYAVSPFQATPLYDDRHTYIYLSSLRALGTGEQVVGGIAIVFDSEPQFAAMLEDALPRNGEGRPLDGAFGVFVGRDGRVIASSRGDLGPGTRLGLEHAPFFELENGARDSALVSFSGVDYAVGAAMSQGYREYKTTGDYENDVLSLIFVPL